MDDNEPQFPDDHNVEDPLIGDAPPKDNVLLSNSVYDKLMPIAQLWLPALAVLYITIAPLWGLPKQEEVAGTIMAVNLFLGAILGISNKQYQNSDGRFDGAINIETLHDEGRSNLNVQLDPASLAEKDEVTVKVNRV